MTKTLGKNILGVALAVCLTSQAWSQETVVRGSIETDRPHVSEGACVVGPGTVQLEAGLLTDLSAGDRPVYNLPALLRVGVSDSWELRLESDSFGLIDQRMGFSDLNLGAKVMLYEGETFDAAALLRLGVYTHGEGFAGHLIPEAKLLIGTDLTDSLAMEVNLGMASIFDGEKGVLEPNFSVALTQSLDDQWSLFGEVFGVGAHRQPVAIFAQGGMMVLLSNDSQFDFEVIKGLTPGSQDWSIGAGYSQRF